MRVIQSHGLRLGDYMYYDREKATAYAQQWGTKRNPAFYNFDGIGGDCTNFVSQCLYAGSGVMNFTRDIGWYYISANNRAAAWTGVEFLHKFLVNNKGIGPFGAPIPIEFVQAGDIIQLSYDGASFGHSLFIVETHPEIMVAQHSTGQNYASRAFSSYLYESFRTIHIEGVRK